VFNFLKTIAFKQEDVSTFVGTTSYMIDFGY
jgi:hypothetical protein